VARIIRTGLIGPSEAYDVLPVYSLVTAGGPFWDNPETRLIGHVHPPENLRSLSSRYFVGRIEGHSMEPRIPSGSYCVFRFFVAGSRSGRTVLVEERKIAECAYTLKRYLRSPISTEGAERGGHIILRSENPEQPDIELNENGESQDQRYDVIAEFVQVLSSPEWVKPAWDE
jgi:uncharacterized protein